MRREVFEVLHIDKRWNIMILFILFLVIRVPSAVAQPMDQDDVRLVGIEAWRSTSQTSKIAFVNGVLYGAYTVDILYSRKYGRNAGSAVKEFVPYGVDADSIVQMIDIAYQFAEFRDWPISQLVIQWKDVLGILRRKTYGSS